MLLELKDLVDKNLFTEVSKLFPQLQTRPPLYLWVGAVPGTWLMNVERDEADHEETHDV